jgi:addiction module HigA family antidote
MIPKHRKPTHPGEIILNDFLIPLNMSQLDLPKHLGWTYAKVNEIINGKRGITEESALCLADAFGTTPLFWMNLQTNHDIWIAQRKHKKIKPIQKMASRKVLGL